MMARLPWPLVRLLLRPAAKNRMPTDDRRILEDIILRDIYGQAAIRRMLFVGCHQYSRWYPGLFRFRARTRIETVDPDPDSRAFGAPVHHQMPFQHLERDDTLRGQFDFIMVNGVFGYGINSDADKRSALDAAKRLLRPDGLFLVGYRAGPYGDFDVRAAGPHFAETAVPGFATPLVSSSHRNHHSFAAFRRKP
jgi:hypothetical protein